MRRTWMAAGLIAALPLASGCDRAPTAPTPVPVPPAIVTAPATLAVAGVTLRLEANAWRDFAPISPTGGSPLYLVMRLRTTSGAPLPDGIGIDNAWVVHESMAWVTVPTPTGAPWGPDVIEFTSREGPRWGPDVPVDVVVRVTGLEGASKLIAVRQVLIERTD
jgi:hypothetical protein